MNYLQIIEALCHAGCGAKSARSMARKIVRSLPADLPDDHVFFDFSRSLRIMKNRETLSDRNVRIFAYKNVDLMFEITGVTKRASGDPKQKNPVKKPVVDPRQVTLTPAQLDAAADILSAKHAVTGKRPWASSDKVEHIDLPGVTSLYMLSGRLTRHAKSNPDCGFTTLAGFMDARGICLPVKTEKISAKISASEIFDNISAAIAAGQPLPRLADEQAIIGGYRIGDLKRAFQRSAVTGIVRFTPEGCCVPRSLQEFLLVSGLVHIKDRKILPTFPPPSNGPRRTYE